MDLDEDVKPNLVVFDHAGSQRSASLDGPFDGPSALDDGKPPIKRRSAIACRRCRRMRSKCVHDKAKPPCKSCLEAGLPPSECVFPVRGQPDNDREYRHPRTRADKTVKRDPQKVRRDTIDSSVLISPGAHCKPADPWESLPPLNEMIDAVNTFTRHYFQLGFIPKEVFPDRLRRDHRSVSVFLLLSILSISARFSPALITRYGSGMKAVDFFMSRASAMAVTEMYEPTLERCQAFYLLSIAQQGSGLKNKSYINMGIAVRMAALMHLHREETYATPPKPTKEMIMQAESARRTLWMLHSQDNLHCGPSSPVSLSANDITALLPSGEDDFANGREPCFRAALEDTPPARENPSLLSRSDRSLFASLIQAHHFWGTVARRAMSYAKSKKPWERESDYAVMARKLATWERELPQDHRWSTYLLKGYKSEGQDLAYLGVTMVTKLCNVVLRKAYLEDMINPDAYNLDRRVFFSDMARELFQNVRDLYEQIDAQFTGRAPEEGVGAQMASFCVYSCGLFSTYMCKYKHICPDNSIAKEAPKMLRRTTHILTESKEVWPLASRWLEALQTFSSDPARSSERSMADGTDADLKAIHLTAYAAPAPEAESKPSQHPPPTKPPIFSPTAPTQQQAFITPRPAIQPLPAHQLYGHPAQQQQQQQTGPPPPYSHNNGMGMLVQAAFDPTAAMAAATGPHPQPQPHLQQQPFGGPEYYTHQPMILGPGTDNFENELQFYITGESAWAGPAPNIYFTIQ